MNDESRIVDRQFRFSCLPGNPIRPFKFNILNFKVSIKNFAQNSTNSEIQNSKTKKISNEMGFVNLK